MRNLFLAALALAAVASCDYIDEPFRNPNGGGSTEANGDTVLQTERAVLVEDFTGHQCKNCPKASKVLKQLDSLYGSAKVIGLAIHAGQPTLRPSLRTTPPTSRPRTATTSPAFLPSGVCR